MAGRFEVGRKREKEDQRRGARATKSPSMKGQGFNIRRKWAQPERSLPKSTEFSPRLFSDKETCLSLVGKS